MKLLAKIRLTVGAKLIGLIAILLMASVASLVWLSTRMFIEDNTALIQQMNADTAASLATQMREQFEGMNERTRVLATVLIQDFQQPELKDRIVREFFTKDKDFLAVVVHKHNHKTGTAEVQHRAVSPDLVAGGFEDADFEKALAALGTDKNFSLAEVAKGEIQLATVKLADGSPAAAIAIPFIQTGEGQFSHTLVAFVKQTRFVKAFSESDIITSFMVDRHGKLVAHPDIARVVAGENVSHLAVVKQLLEGKFNNGQTRYVDGEAKLGAFRVVGFGGLGVVAEVPEAKATEAANRVKFRSMLLAATILFISFFVGYLYSGTITWPIKQLVIAAGRISAGDFKINLKPRGRDEVAHLSTAFNEMAKGLEERDKVKETFNKFHNKEIADKLLSGEVNLGGERRECTIFFSDVRGFTGLSESMQPEQVVEMLNEYMTCMVAIIRRYHGIVDKYVGDAIMALWGVPVPKSDDHVNALRACVEMRVELAKLNELRISRGQPPLKIGMGLNTGPVIAGNIGSTEKMEYTVIGDSVNLASRIESMTKEYGTDLLVSSNMYEKVKDKFVFENCKSAKVKGKADAIVVYKVKGYYDEQGQAVLVETPYSSYAAEKSDKVVHDDHGGGKGAEEKHAAPAAEMPAPAPVVPLVTAPDVAPVVVPASQPAAPPPAAIVPEKPIDVLRAFDDLPIPVIPADLGIVVDPTSVAADKAAGEENTGAFNFLTDSTSFIQAPVRVPVEPVVEPVVEEERTDPSFVLPQEAVPQAEARLEDGASTHDQWFIHAEGEIYGPFSRQEIVGGIQSQELQPTMTVSRDLQGKAWTPLSAIPEFKGAFSAPAGHRQAA